MPIFAVVFDGAVREYREYSTQPECKLIAGVPTVRPVVELAKPAFDSTTQYLARQEEIFNDRVEWSWVVAALPADQIAANVQQATDLQDKTEVKLEAQVQNFVAMTPAQVNNYIDTQVTDLASAKQVLKFFGRMLLILVRREYR